VLPEVGEMVTSLDMAGCSLSITWLDEELERYWCAPADTVSFRRGGSNAPDFERVGAVVTTQAHPGVAAVEASEASQAASEVIRRVLEVANDALVADEDRLGRLDAVAGDGDHGVGMTRGMRAAVAAARSTQGGAATVLRAAGDAFGDRAGGTSGMLWGLFLSSIGESLGDHAPVDGRALATAMADGAAAMQRVGKAQPGDKTMLDALLPFVADIDAGLEAGDPLAVAWRHAASVAAGSAEATASLVARIGRARPLAERSIGTPDPGATSMGLILVAVADVFDAC
jgi:dihydroxyacetone kinase